ncbi:MAG: cytochrome c biogenesis heme-transporting ATPase CcmA [Betaproteobacteria bacterium]|nr:cytochrome c biogenesis heme-transporting ATPase CcmA [Betaproteobacteria bacterium]MDH4325461.1 cytochrome c biogenesis heme-transporting ATPase CcmA [Betaproteobacteria bacterium]
MLEAAGLECVRQRRTLFAGLSFALGGGELLRIAGANGSGKTSLLKILCGLLSPDGGEVRWQGTPIRRLREDYSRNVVYLGHAPAVKDDLTATENLIVACALAGRAASPQQARAALDSYGLQGHDVAVRRLSQGQRRRAALARLLLSADAPLWLLDEPFAALDTAAARFTEALIASHVAAGGAAIYTTHQEANIGAAVLRVVELG